MADAVTSAASAATAAALAGAPPDMVVLGAIVGAAVSLWSRPNAAMEFTLRWFFGAFSHSAVAIASGVVGSTMLMTIAPAWAMTAPLTLTPQWTWSVALAGGAHWLLPLVGSLIRARVTKETDGAQ